MLFLSSRAFSLSLFHSVAHSKLLSLHLFLFAVAALHSAPHYDKRVNLFVCSYLYIYILIKKELFEKAHTMISDMVMLI